MPIRLRRWNLILFLLVAIFLLAKAADGGEPKTVYIRVWNETEQGHASPDSLTFSCHLEYAGWRSEIRTHYSVGFDYLVTEDEKIHHLSIQCGNFSMVNWSPGDRLIVRVITDAIPNREHLYSVVLDAEGEQYDLDMILKMGI